jgi:hypothetical protein
MVDRTRRIWAILGTGPGRIWEIPISGRISMGSLRLALLLQKKM